MIVYEITAKVKFELAEEFENFMRQRHVPDLIATGYFESAEMSIISEGDYRIRYLCRDRKTLEKYFEEDAERLREDFIKNFPAGVEVSREILEVLERWEK